jgi:hypothetical protein
MADSRTNWPVLQGYKRRLSSPQNSEEVVNLFPEEPVDSKIIFPLPDDSPDVEKKTIKIQVEPEIALTRLNEIGFPLPGYAALSGQGRIVQNEAVLVK